MTAPEYQPQPGTDFSYYCDHPQCPGDHAAETDSCEATAVSGDGMSATDTRWQDDTRSRSRSAATTGDAQDGAAGDCTRENPRAAGAASARGAQPPASGPHDCAVSRLRFPGRCASTQPHEHHNWESGRVTFHCGGES